MPASIAVFLRLTIFNIALSMPTVPARLNPAEAVAILADLIVLARSAEIPVASGKPCQGTDLPLYIAPKDTVLRLDLLGAPVETMKEATSAISFDISDEREVSEYYSFRFPPGATPAAILDAASEIGDISPLPYQETLPMSAQRLARSPPRGHNSLTHKFAPYSIPTRLDQAKPDRRML
ncbi:hypothetical protein BV22DRAFT_880645 [Leucogyrophana mollusca]|uniref:Uncharacterized protein n=1 Tax=Leucogyrophana mollusca TaxID=85980 RepID=A0ACB8B092_9AGAM|nr:hypothetical protein BV22DRAFT_880645 [Leucogyrophana mollusca]